MTVSDEKPDKKPEDAQPLTPPKLPERDPERFERGLGREDLEKKRRGQNDG
jgi:hypothetical protein